MVTHNDITLTIGLRFHVGNPWVLSRLEALSGYYDPEPEILIVDFGSKDEFRDAIASICKLKGFRLVHIPDYGPYSISLSRNVALEDVTRNYIFFMDIDFIGARSLFADLAKIANSAGMDKVFDTILDIPAYHISESETRKLESLENPEEKSLALEKIGFSSQFTAFGDQVEFIAPYSNVLMISRDFFNYTGGYNVAFRGHGSEDFEFFIRCAIHSSYFGLPRDIRADRHGPTKKDFWLHRDFSGFRSLNQLIAARSERAGLKIYHLWHPRQNNTSWRKENDWKRVKLNGVLDKYIDNHAALLEIDGHRREKKAICICINPDHWGYFVPLRLHGYELLPVYNQFQKTIDHISGLIEGGAVDAMAIFNPYMKSHAAFYPLFLLAKKQGVETIVIERGALPNTFYYSDDVSYASPSFGEAAMDKIRLTPEERTGAVRYIKELKSGKLVLEESSSYKFTARKYKALRNLERKIIFVPLQLEDDIAVTRFVRDSQPYDEFYASLTASIRANSSFLFLVKPHPLSKQELTGLPENAIIADRKDNVHTLIDMCDFVICYNSGVGLLAVCHGKPLVTIGNAFYNLNGIGQFADSLNAAIELVETNPFNPNKSKVEKLVGSYLYRKYSWFVADDFIREFKTRRAHDYKKLRSSRSVVSGKAIEHNWERVERPFSKMSYGFAIANFEDAAVQVQSPNTKRRWVSDNEKMLAASLLFKLYAKIYGLGLSQTQYRNLLNSPEDFFRKAKHPFSRFGKFLFRKYL